MIVVDETPECQNALRFAARRAANTGGVGFVELAQDRPLNGQLQCAVARLEQRQIGRCHPIQPGQPGGKTFQRVGAFQQQAHRLGVGGEPSRQIAATGRSEGVDGPERPESVAPPRPRPPEARHSGSRPEAPPAAARPGPPSLHPSR